MYYRHLSSFVVLSITLFCGLLLLNMPAQAQPRIVPVFTQSAHYPAQRALASAFAAAKRARNVTIHQAIFEPTELQEGDILHLELFPDQVIHAKITRVRTDVNGVRSIRANIEHWKYGYVVFSIAQNQLLGQIIIPGLKQEYTIHSLGDGMGHVLQEIDPAKKDVLPEKMRPIAPPTLQHQSPLRSRPLSNPAEPVTIDVLVVYTQAAHDWAADHANSIAHVISQALEQGQLTLDNSEVGIELNLVHSAQIAYSTSGNSSTDLDNLTDGRAGLDIVHQWRDQYGADLVVLLSRVEDTGGVAWQLDQLEGASEYGFSLTRVQQAHDTYTVIHEIGHNMGANHHKQQSVEPGPTDWQILEDFEWVIDRTRRYSAGWRWVDPQVADCCVSVMTYEDGQFFADRQTRHEVPHFSNPSVTHHGVVTGDAEHGDNARTLRETRAVVASYRDPVTPTMSQHSALLALYQATAGGQWINNHGWRLGIEGSECTWFGVTCRNGQVTRLMLWNNGLTGSLPPELKHLRQLEFLVLRNNQLRGPIPAEIGELTELQLLFLGNNQFSGEIPEQLEQLSQLRWLDLHNNQLSASIPAFLGELHKLQWLYLGDNQLSGAVPESLIHLEQLQQLDIANNCLSVDDTTSTVRTWLDGKQSDWSLNQTRCD